MPRAASPANLSPSAVKERAMNRASGLFRSNSSAGSVAMRDSTMVGMSPPHGVQYLRKAPLLRVLEVAEGWPLARAAPPFISPAGQGGQGRLSAHRSHPRDGVALPPQFLQRLALQAGEDLLLLHH